MNNYTKLFIDNTEIDLFKAEDLPLNVTKRVNNIEGEIQGDYSRASVSVPATKNNINILGNTKNFKPFRIETDGAPSFSGTAQIKKVKTFSQGYEAINLSYEINLISNNSSWFILLGEKLLSECTDLVVNWNYAIMSAGFIAEPNLRNYAFPLIKYKEWENSTGAGPSLLYQPSIFETTPALYIRPLIIEAFNSIGYKIQSDFFNTDLFSKLIIPLPLPEKMPFGYNEKYLNTSVSLSAPFAVSGLSNLPCDVIDKAAPQNPTAYNTVTYEYTAPQKGYYECNIELEFSSPAPVPPYFFIIFLQLNTINVFPNIGFAFDSGGVPALHPSAGEKLNALGVVFAQAGDIIKWELSGLNCTIISALATFTGEAVPEPGFNIDFKYLLQNWKLLDMLKGLNCMFNLSYETNENSKTVYIEPKDKYRNTARFIDPLNPTLTTDEIKEGFYKSEDQKDFSKLIDYKKAGSFEFPALAGVFAYRYKADSFEETINFVEGINETKIYDSKYQLTAGADLKNTQTKEVPFFVKTIHVSDHLIKFPDTNTVPQIPLIYPQNYVLDPTSTTAQTADNISPRLLYFAGQRGPAFEEIDGTIEWNEFAGVKMRLPFAFMVNYNDSTGLDANLGFNTQTINGTESSGLLQRYYLQELARNNSGELRKNYVKFGIIDKQNFSFRIKGLIDNQRYIIQELTGFNPLKDSPTQFKFYLDIVPSQDDINNIQNSPLLSVVSLLST
jgi:hypothetical protein